MCIAVPGELIEQEGTRGKVSVNGNILPVELGVVNAKVGDFLLVHAGIAISILCKEEKEELEDLLALLTEETNEEH